jgi:hypothetical protein
MDIIRQGIAKTDPVQRGSNEETPLAVSDPKTIVKGVRDPMRELAI